MLEAYPRGCGKPDGNPLGWVLRSTNALAGRSEPLSWQEIVCEEQDPKSSSWTVEEHRDTREDFERAATLAAYGLVEPCQRPKGHLRGGHWCFIDKVSRPPGAAQTPKIGDFRSVKTSYIKNPGAHSRPFKRKNPSLTAAISLTGAAS